MPNPTAGKRRDQTTPRNAGKQQRVAAVIQAARKAGLLNEKGGRIGVRVSPTLVAQAKAETGIEADTDLIEFALANIALKDDFAERFAKLKGTVDPTLDLEF